MLRERAAEREVPPEVVGEDRLPDGDEQQRAAERRGAVGERCRRRRARGSIANHERRRSRAPPQSRSGSQRKRKPDAAAPHPAIRLERPGRGLAELVGLRERGLEIAEQVVAAAHDVDARHERAEARRVDLELEAGADPVVALLLVAGQRELRGSRCRSATLPIGVSGA